MDSRQDRSDLDAEFRHLVFGEHRATHVIGILRAIPASDWDRRAQAIRDVHGRIHALSWADVHNR